MPRWGSLLDNFESKTKQDMTTGCWIWTGAKTREGYGCFGYKDKIWGAHRASYEIYVGPIKEKMHVLHACDIRLCVNPEHLFLGSHKDNMNDMISKGRQRWRPIKRKKGASQREANRALSEENVLFILSNPHISTREIGRTFNVCKSTVYAIRKRKTWKHIEE